MYCKNFILKHKIVSLQKKWRTSDNPSDYLKENLVIILQIIVEIWDNPSDYL